MPRPNLGLLALAADEMEVLLALVGLAGDVLRWRSGGPSVITEALLQTELASRLCSDEMLCRQDIILSGEPWLSELLRRIPVPMRLERVETASQDSCLRLAAAQSCLKILMRPL